MAETTMLTGSICLSEIPRSQMKKVMCRDGKERLYLNIAVIARKAPQTFTSSNGAARTFTHFVSCAPKKEEREEGVSYILGDLETRSFGPAQPSVEDIQAAPSVGAADNLPF